MASSNRIQILDQAGIMARLKRMAFEIYEANYQASKLFIIGIDQRGGFLARELQQMLKSISPLDTHFVQARLDRSGEAHDLGITLDLEQLDALKGHAVLVVDDVLYTGTTLLNVVAILLQAGPSSLRNAVLIDRGHRNMPVSADFVGLELATTIQQHVSVEIESNTRKVQAFLL